MKIRYNVEMEDLVAFNQYVIQNSVYYRRQRIIITIIFPVIYMTLGCIHARAENSLAPIVIWGVASLLFSFWYYRSSRRVNPKRIERIYSREKNKGVLCEHEIEIIADGMYEKTIAGEQKTFFVGIERVETTSTHTFIFIGTMMAHVIPRNKLLEGNLDVFISTLKEKIQLVEQTKAPVQT